MNQTTSPQDWQKKAKALSKISSADAKAWRSISSSSAEQPDQH
jgi:hypothetical protein